LKAHIFDIELNEKNFVKLNSKFKMLQNEFNLLSDEKLKLEYEYKTKSESTNKQLNDLRYDLENLRIAFTEKLSQNKKLFQDYSNIQIILETKTNEINDLHLQLNENVQDNGKLYEEKSDLEKIVQELRENKYRNKSDYDRMQEENQKLHKKCKEEEFIIKNLEQERNRLLSLNEELKYENSNLHSKIKQRDENLIYYQKQLDDSNKTISRMSNNIKDLETQSDRLRLELENQTNINIKANRIRIEHEITYEKFSRLITEKEGEIKNLINQLDSLTIQKEKLYEDNTKMYNEIDRLKNHIYVLTQQNEKVIYFKLIYINS